MIRRRDYPFLTGPSVPSGKEVNMNRDQLEGNWKQLVGTVRNKWGELTDDDLQQVQGNYEKLQGKLQERYGYTKERAQREVNDWLESAQGG
jgi:uncharacterized protein YjbJ (UPF0337 family)